MTFNYIEKIKEKTGWWLIMTPLKNIGQSININQPSQILTKNEKKTIMSIKPPTRNLIINLSPMPRLWHDLPARSHAPAAAKRRGYHGCRGCRGCRSRPEPLPEPLERRRDAGPAAASEWWVLPGMFATPEPLEPPELQPLEPLPPELRRCDAGFAPTSQRWLLPGMFATPEPLEPWAPELRRKASNIGDEPTTREML